MVILQQTVSYRPRQVTVPMYPWTRPLCQLCLSETMFMKIIMKILLMKINSGQQQSPQPTLYSLTHVLENIFHLSLANTVTVALGSIHRRMGFNFGLAGVIFFCWKIWKIYIFVGVRERMFLFMGRLVRLCRDRTRPGPWRQISPKWRPWCSLA